MLPYVYIKNNQVFSNGHLLFEQNNDESLTSLLSGLYLFSELSYPKYHKMDNLCKLGFLASEFLIKSTALTNKFSLDKIGIVLSNAASSLDTDRQHQLSIIDKSTYFPSPAVFVYTLANIVIGEIAIKHKITGENAFFISEKFDADTLVNYAHLLFTGNTEAVLSGWVEVDDNNYETFLFIIEKNNLLNASEVNAVLHNLQHTK